MADEKPTHRSAEWLEQRKGRITGSRVGATKQKAGGSLINWSTYAQHKKMGATVAVALGWEAAMAAVEDWLS